ncbi:MAG TPA: YcxB family protein [Patescibacteria group bacterium]
MKFIYNGKISANDLALFQLASALAGRTNYVYFLFLMAIFLLPMYASQYELIARMIPYLPLIVIGFFVSQYLLFYNAASNTSPFEAIIDSEGATSIDKMKSKFHFKWDSFKFYVEVYDHLFLFFENNQAFIIAKRFLSSDEEWQRLIEFVREKIPEKKQGNSRNFFLLAVIVFFLLAQLLQYYLYKK